MARKVCFNDTVEEIKEKSCVIEFQSFRGNINEYIIKELVILDLVKYVVYSFLFKPPFSFKKLKTKIKITNKWMINHFHHIRWTEGFVSYQDVDSIMYHFCTHFNQIYTVGLEKRNWIQLYTTNQVYDVKVDPSFQIYYDNICIHAKNKQHAKSNCALRNAYRLAAFVQQNGDCSGGYKYEETALTQHQYFSKLQGDNTYNSSEDVFTTVSTISS